MHALSRETVRRLVTDFYIQVWNARDPGAAHHLLHPELSFRGTLGRHTTGVAEFLDYVAVVRAAFPDFHNQVTDVVAEGSQAVARLTYTGTHLGAVLGYPPTGNPIRYSGIAWFQVLDGCICSVFALGDVDSLRAQLRPHRGSA